MVTVVKFQLTQKLVSHHNTNVFIEHFTSPSLSNSIFTANTGPSSISFD